MPQAHLPKVRAACPRKKRFGGREAAENAMTRLLCAPDCVRHEYLNVYLCPRCHGWHIGHSSHPLSRVERGGKPSRSP